MKLFAENDFENYSRLQIWRLESEIKEVYGETFTQELFEELTSNYSVPKATFIESTYEVEITIERKKDYYFIDLKNTTDNETTAFVNYSYKVNYLTEELEILCLCPSLYFAQEYQINVSSNSVDFKILTDSPTLELPENIISEVTQIRDKIIAIIIVNIDFLNSDIDIYNEKVKKLINDSFDTNQKIAENIRIALSKL